MRVRTPVSVASVTSVLHYLNSQTADHTSRHHGLCNECGMVWCPTFGQQPVHSRESGHGTNVEKTRVPRGKCRGKGLHIHTYTSYTLSCYSVVK